MKKYSKTVVIITLLLGTVLLFSLKKKDKTGPMDLRGCWYFTNRNIENNVYDSFTRIEMIKVKKNTFILKTEVDEEDLRTIEFKGNTFYFSGEGDTVSGDYKILSKGKVILFENFTRKDGTRPGDLAIIELIFIRCGYLETWKKEHNLEQK